MNGPEPDPAPPGRPPNAFPSEGALGAEPPRASIEQDAFFRKAGSPPDEPLARWIASPGKQAGVFVALGFFGVFLAQANIIFQIVVGAPIFEELLKFGVALALVTALRIGGPVTRFVIALGPGALFGVLEHQFSYGDEGARGFLVRVLFHAASPALSMAVYDAVKVLPDQSVRWAVTLPSSLLHWLNNFVAILLGVASIAAEEIIEGPALAFSASVTAVLWMTAIFALIGHATVAGVAHRLWTRFAPHALRTAEPPAAAPPVTGAEKEAERQGPPP